MATLQLMELLAALVEMAFLAAAVAFLRVVVQEQTQAEMAVLV